MTIQNLQVSADTTLALSFRLSIRQRRDLSSPALWNALVSSGLYGSVQLQKRPQTAREC